MSLSAIEYAPVIILLVISTVLSSIIFFLSFFVASQRPDNEKTSAYECGFDPFDDARGKFDIRFYLVAILFIIFDLEVSFLFPWSLILGEIGFFGFWTMIIF